MKIVRSLAELEAQPSRPSVVTIGNFDGVHRGHQQVLGEVVTSARQRSAEAVAITFDPHPAAILRPQQQPQLILPLEVRLQLLAATGLDSVVVLPFTRELSRWTSREFVARVLRDALAAVEVHEGENFRLGADAQTDTEGLRALGLEFGFEVRSYEALQLRGGAVSSSRIRKLIREGNVNLARTLLDRPFSLYSTPASGRGYGTRYAVPTINLAPTQWVAPGNGVYATHLQIGSGGEEQGFYGVTNAGVRPTFGEDSYAIETHLFDFEPLDLSESTPLKLTFLHRLREERRFPDPGALREQIGLDVARAQTYFRRACDQGTGE